MTLNDTNKLLNSLDKLKCKGGAKYKQVFNLLNQEATTHNIEQAKQLLAKLTN